MGRATGRSSTVCSVQIRLRLRCTHVKRCERAGSPWTVQPRDVPDERSTVPVWDATQKNRSSRAPREENQCRKIESGAGYAAAGLRPDREVSPGHVQRSNVPRMTSLSNRRRRRVRFMASIDQKKCQERAGQSQKPPDAGGHFHVHADRWLQVAYQPDSPVLRELPVAAREKTEKR
jgi:hypothetical protein